MSGTSRGSTRGGGRLRRPPARLRARFGGPNGGGRTEPPSIDRWRDLPTEAVHPRADALDALDTDGLVALLLAEEARAVRDVALHTRRIARVAERFAAAIAGGGRVVYAGAGTSGRLGALDAAELPPTFGMKPSRVVALVAGGATALRRSVEGAEDSAAAARRGVARLRVGELDLLIGIAATAFVTCGAHGRGLADEVIAIATGPEVVAGSTRLKAGTATKLVLNAISTAAMMKLGKVYRGRMVDVMATNAKLRARALRTIAELAGVDGAQAARLLRAANGSVRLALAAALLGVSSSQARRRLAAAAGRLGALVPRG